MSGRVSNEDLAMFAQINANHPRMLEHLQAEHASAVKFMTQGRDMVMVHRYQGEVIALEKLIKLMTTAQDIIEKMRKGAA